MNPTPADGTEPNRPQDGTLAPTAPGQPLTRTQKILTGIVVGAVLIIASLGFIGSYSAVTRLALNKGFGQFAHAFPLAIDAGIIAFLALDLLLTWRRIPYPLLRYTAWTLTAATIAFNAVVAWPDPVGSTMHGVIPVLFVIAVEAARHAIGRLADITADKHIEGPNTSRWFLNPAGTFILWRRQRLWGIRTWDTVLELERERRIYIAQLRKEHGRWAWRRKAPADKLLILWLATKNGMSVTEATALPAREEEKRRQEADRIAREAQQAADERRREQEAYEREQQRLADERARKAEADRLERERQELALEQARIAAARQQQIADAEARAQLAEIARRQQQAAQEDERRQREEQLAHARQVAAEQQRAAEAARRRRENEEAAARAAAEKEAASRRAAAIVQRATVASANGQTANGSASANPAPASQTANAATNPTASAQTGSASTASANAASQSAASDRTANASASQSAATGASAVDIQQVVDVYQLLEQQLGKAPSDQKLGDALGVSRSRAQQLRTLAIQAGHTELAKPLRIAS